MPRQKKNKYDELSADFRYGVESGDEVYVRKVITDAAIYREFLAEEKKGDRDLQEAQERFSSAGAQYREGEKQYRLQIAFCRQVLKDRGQNVP